MKKLLITCFLLSGCGTMQVENHGAYKHIEYSNPPGISVGGEPGGQFAIPQTQIEMSAMANKECSSGYTVLKQGLSSNKKAFFWDIKCSS